jgi:hypothetical protein
VSDEDQVAMPRDRTQLVLVCSPAVLALAAIIVAVVIFITSPRRPMASQADCDRIEVGMSLAEVEHILGGPPGNYGTGPSVPPPLPYGNRYMSWDEWQGDGGMVLVQFDDDGRVFDKAHFDLMPRQRSLIERILSKK